MTTKALEKKLRPLGIPVDEGLLRWLYLHLPPQPIKTKRMHRSYAAAIRILMRERESGSLTASDSEAVSKYLSALIPFVEQYEKKEFPIAAATPEEVLRFLMEEHDLSQYDLAKELGGQPVVSDILRGKRRLSREHIERLSDRFGVAPASFYPQDPAEAFDLDWLEQQPQIRRVLERGLADVAARRTIPQAEVVKRFPRKKRR